MNYYLFRNFSTKEAQSVYKTARGIAISSEYTQRISQAEFETYIEFGIPETKVDETGREYYR